MLYYFNLAGVVQTPDDKGVELGSLSDARIQAVRFASDYLHSRPEAVWKGEEFRVEVADAERAEATSFREASRTSMR